MKDTLKDLGRANDIITKQYRYSCGLSRDPEEAMAENSRIFFESPDGQNVRLYRELLVLGYEDTGYKAPYFWKVQKGNVVIRYVEGDIYINETN